MGQPDKPDIQHVITYIKWLEEERIRLFNLNTSLLGEVQDANKRIEREATVRELCQVENEYLSKATRFDFGNIRVEYEVPDIVTAGSGENQDWWRVSRIDSHGDRRTIQNPEGGRWWPKSKALLEGERLAVEEARKESAE